MPMAVECEVENTSESGPLLGVAIRLDRHIAGKYDKKRAKLQRRESAELDLSYLL